jgi:hypothetical protein
MSKVYANGRSVIHKGDGQVNTCAVPDVCKTPSPGGPVPIPYVNVARDGDLAQGSTSVHIEGNSVALKDSNLSTSSGDEPGTAGGGLVSSKTKGKMTWASASIDVKFEGKGVVRFLEPTQHNGNTFNTAFVQKGGTGLAYGDDPAEGRTKCPVCKEKKPEHRILETPQAQSFTRTLLKELSATAKLEGLESTLKKKQVKQDKKKVTLLSGYMVGTLLCKCNTKIFASMSGSYHLDSFGRTVDRLKLKDPRWTQCAPLDLGGTFTNPRGDTMLLSQLPDYGNPPGVCAAPQLIQKALNEGHIPAAMSEMWYRPAIPNRTFRKSSSLEPASLTVTVNYLRNGTEVTTAFNHRESVPSCKTCQASLTQMLCSVNDKTC